MRNSKNRLLIAVCTLILLLVICAVPTLAEEISESEMATETAIATEEAIATETAAVTAATEATKAPETQTAYETDIKYPDATAVPEDTTYIKPEYTTETGAQEDTTEPTNYGSIYMLENPITYVEGGTYQMQIFFRGNASTFSIELYFPYFVNVEKVIFSENLITLPNAVYTSNVYGNVARASFSAAENYSGGMLLSVMFSLNQSGNNSGYVEVCDWQFVNSDAEVLDMDIQTAPIIVTNNIIMGDVDRNGAVNLADVMMILRYYTAQKSFSESTFEAADINNDGCVDMIDAQYIQNYLVGKIDSLEDINGGNNSDSGDQNYVKYNYGDSEGYGYIFFADMSVQVANGNGEVGVGKWWYRGEYVMCHDPLRGTLLQFTVNDNGNLVPVEICKHENSNILNEVEATCTDYGWIDYECLDCGESYSVDLEPTGHSYAEDGKCSVCGAVEGDVGYEEIEMPDFAYALYDGKDVVFLYEDGRAIYFADVDAIEADMGGYIDDTGSWKWNEYGNIMLATFPEYRVNLAFVFDGRTDDSIALIEGLTCGHSGAKIVDIKYSTCRETGSVIISCDECKEEGLEYVVGLNPEVHNYNEEGVCGDCGLVAENTKDEEAESGSNDSPSNGDANGSTDNGATGDIPAAEEAEILYYGEDDEHRYNLYADGTIKVETVSYDSNGEESISYVTGEWFCVASEDGNDFISTKMSNGITYTFDLNKEDGTVVRR